MTLKRFQTYVELNLAFARFGVEYKRDYSLKLSAAIDILWWQDVKFFFCQKLITGDIENKAIIFIHDDEVEMFCFLGKLVIIKLKFMTSQQSFFICNRLTFKIVALNQKIKPYCF
jgi:hypothetical protein